MITAATRRLEYRAETAGALYLAFELGEESWKLGFTLRKLRVAAAGSPTETEC